MTLLEVVHRNRVVLLVLVRLVVLVVDFGDLKGGRMVLGQRTADGGQRFRGRDRGRDDLLGVRLYDQHVATGIAVRYEGDRLHIAERGQLRTVRISAGAGLRDDHLSTVRTTGAGANNLLNGNDLSVIRLGRCFG